MTPKELKSVLIVPYDTDKYRLSVMTHTNDHYVYNLTTENACRMAAALMQVIIDERKPPTCPPT